MLFHYTMPNRVTDGDKCHDLSDIINYRQFYPNLAQGGMPTQAQLLSLAEAGFDQVINITAFSPGRNLLGERAIVSRSACVTITSRSFGKPAARQY